ncbi:MAG TPA: amidohydrolase family protein, partial [Dongiaceae bacterium]|nr:amidohydrolase family protein [Dongiaceae bacterium]
MRVTAVLLVALASGCVHTVHYAPLVSRSDSPKLLVIHDVSVFAATGPDLVAHRDVVVRDGTIEAIVPAGGADAPPDARVIEGAGRTLLPGLVDAHAHVTFDSPPPWFKTLPDTAHNLQAHLFAGTTTVFDTGAEIAGMREVRAKLADGEWIGPRMKFAGPIVTRRNGYPYAYIRKVLPWPLPQVIASRVMRRIDTPEEGRAVVRELVKAQTDYVKVVVAQTPPSAARLDGDTLRAVVEAAHASGRKVIAHIDTAENALIAARAGVDVLVHGVHSTPLSKEEAQELASLHVTVVPTLVTFERLDELANDRVSFSPMERASEPRVLLDQYVQSKGRAAGFKLDPELETWLKRLTTYRQDRLV